MSETKYTAADYKAGQPRWCPGCGDHAFLNSFHKALAELGVPPHEIAVISGIGCSSRLPYYMNTYGMHTICIHIIRQTRRTSNTRNNCNFMGGNS